MRDLTRVIPSYPHCDSRVLHAPGECIYCDSHPAWQALRQAWGVRFTGKSEPADYLPCPSDAARGLGGAHVWPGNKPRPPDSPDPVPEF